MCTNIQYGFIDIIWRHENLEWRDVLKVRFRKNSSRNYFTIFFFQLKTGDNIWQPIVGQFINELLIVSIPSEIAFILFSHINYILLRWCFRSQTFFYTYCVFVFTFFFFFLKKIDRCVQVLKQMLPYDINECPH